MAIRLFPTLFAVVCVLLLAPLAAPTISARNDHVVLALAQPLDTDGDGIPDDVDPDDDNDGVFDFDDYAPLDQTIQNPPADPQDPDGTANEGEPLHPDSGNEYDQDSDSDGIPDDLDPDDNNNAIVDGDEPVEEAPGDEEPAEQPDPVIVPTPEPLSEVPSGSTREETAAQLPPAPLAPVVTSLPDTGTGMESSLPNLLIAVVAGLGLIAVRIRTNRPSG